MSIRAEKLYTDAERLSIRQASEWYARLSDRSASLEDQRHWQQWLDEDIHNRQAWQRVEAINHQMMRLPADLNSPLLRSHGASRRQVLGGLVLMAGAGGLCWMGSRSDTWQQWSADYTTAVGERRAFELADGSSLILNTHSAVQVDFSDNERRLLLCGGEILINTAQDSRAQARPFKVTTRDGEIEALGTHFSVRVDDDKTRVAVLEKTVAISPQSYPQQRTLLQAREHLSFNRTSVGQPVHNTAATASWQYGSLIALDMPLGELLSELARYRPGVLRVDPAVQQLRISGSFPLNDTDKVLSALQSSYPLHVVYRTRYWVSVMPVV